MGQAAMRLAPCYAANPNNETTTLGTTFPTLRKRCVGSLMSPANYITLKMQETGPTVFCPYPRRLECLTICRCKYKGSTFSSGILRPRVLVWSGLEPSTPHTAVHAFLRELTRRRLPSCLLTSVPLTY